MVHCLGEALIDMLAIDGEITKGFNRYAGGSPANVSACVSILGGKSSLISKVGNDENGIFIKNKLKGYGVDVSNVFLTNDKKTGVVYFSSNVDDMNELCAERKDSADRFLYAEEVDESLFESSDILHYSSICFVDAPVKQAQLKAVECMLKAGGRLSFDINYRPMLWKSKDDFIDNIFKYICYPHYLKLSEYDYSEIINDSHFDNGIKTFFDNGIRLKTIILTRGDKGANVYLRNGEKFTIKAFNTKVMDTLGAGDCFMGCFLYFIDKLRSQPTLEQLKQIILFATAASAIHVTKKGAMDSIPTPEQVKKYLEENKIEDMEILNN